MKQKRTIILCAALCITTLFSSCKQTRLLQEDSINDTVIAEDSLIDNRDSIISAQLHVIDSLNSVISFLDSVNNYSLFKIMYLEQTIKDTLTRIESTSKFVSRYSKRKDTDFFCRAVFEAPLFEAYNPANIEYCKQTIAVMGYDKEDNYCYNTYIDLIDNYERYTRELAEFLNELIERFEILQAEGVKPNREIESNNFKSFCDADWSYYKKRGKGGKNQWSELKYIFYLDHQVSQLKEIFNNDNKFSRKTIQAVRDRISKHLPRQD